MSLIHYILSFENDSTLRFEINTERQPELQTLEQPAQWIQLETHRCPNCPLKISADRACPAALDIADIVSKFSHVDSHRQVKVEVHMHGRVHSRQTDVQTTLHSLMGLILATSACPILSRMKGPARLHMPFATMDETVFRMVGAYFLGKYRQSQQGLQVEWSLHELMTLYESVQVVNQHLKKRLDMVACKDANQNAVVSLMSMAMLVSFSLDDNLQELSPFALGGYGACD